MFTHKIDELKLASAAADRLFENITCSSLAPDNTFIATLRAVLYGKLPASERIHLNLVPVTIDKKSYENATDKQVMQTVINNYTSGLKANSVNISIVYAYFNDFSADFLKIISKSVGSEKKKFFSNFTAQEDLRVFYIKKFKGLFYNDGVNTIIFLEKLDLQIFHALQIMIPKYLPQYFETLSKEETDLFISLNNKNSWYYGNLIEQFASKVDMRKEMITMHLRDFGTVRERIQLAAAQRDISIYKKDYEMHQKALKITLGQIRRTEITIAGLEAMTKSKDKCEVMEYFLLNKNLIIISVKGVKMVFVAHGYMDSFDEDAFDTYVNNLNSYLYKNIYKNVKTLQKFYKTVFSERTYKLRICAAYKFDTQNSISAMLNFSFPPECRTYIPNPHINEYTCLGDYTPRINESIKNRDYVGAIILAENSARNLNFHDSGIIIKFIKSLLSTSIKCIEDAEGNLMAPMELIKKLEEKA